VIVKFEARFELPDPNLVNEGSGIILDRQFKKKNIYNKKRKSVEGKVQKEDGGYNTIVYLNSRPRIVIWRDEFVLKINGSFLPRDSIFFKKNRNWQFICKKIN